MSASISVKLVLLGGSAVGKSSLVLRFVRNSFIDYQEPTIGAAFLTQTVVIDDTTIKFEIWDTAGQERYGALAPMYYRGAPAAVVVYDITSPPSFKRAKEWVEELRRETDDDVVIALAGNKCDLEAKRRIPTEDGQSYAAANNLLFMETSAKQNIGVSQLFQEIAKALPQDVTQKQQAPLLIDEFPQDDSGCGC
eukprot:gnl/Dysnectes_brevis/1109_a1240_4317.p1 GENE.gnl/Dysnectes_brevis/1109_a1240_4317~~gnl/Dysnectes_brevis/1109_a1240_4317.p1  ORF type:complete len:207 (-),score=16.62 gnl/Dysnectes_brevis/1109_a1240_4317:74-655(-)